MSSSCTYSGVPDGHCPQHYDFDPATRVCVWNGGRSVGIDCPAGEFYDPVAHCCRITSGNIVDFPVCPLELYSQRPRTTPTLFRQPTRPAPELEPINPPVWNMQLTVPQRRNLVLPNDLCVPRRRAQVPRPAARCRLNPLGPQCIIFCHQE
jgi:hypothetical protein